MSGNTPLPLTIRVDSFQKTDIGKKRTNNEDFVTSHEPNTPEELEYSGCLYIVADGVGGANKGEKASTYAGEKILYDYYQDPSTSPGNRLRKLLRSVGNEIYTYGVERGLGRIATTVVAAVIRGDQLTIANVGDSRAYLVRNGAVRQLTHDHNQASELVRNGTLTEEEAAHSKVKNVLTRSVGGHLDVEADLFEEIRLVPEDVIILCTDGLHRYLQNDQQLAGLIDAGSPESICNRLVEFAIHAGGVDNITTLVIAIRAAEAQTGKLHRSQKDPVAPLDLDLIQTEPPLKEQVKFPFLDSSSRKLVIIGLLAAALLITLLSLILQIPFGPGPKLPTTANGLNARLTPSQISANENNSSPASQVPENQAIGDHSTSAPGISATSGSTAIPEATKASGHDVMPGTASPATPAILPSLAISTQTITQQPGDCVKTPDFPGEGMEELLSPFQIPYANITYFYYETCDLDSKQCSQMKKIGALANGSPNVPNRGYIIIPDLTKLDVCEGNGGLWVNSGR